MKRIFILILLINKLVAQDSFQIRGNVSSQKNELPLPMVSITNLKSEQTTISDFDGNYIIMANEGDVLKFSFLGMQDHYITVKLERVIDIKMKELSKMLKDKIYLNLGISKSKEKVAYAFKKIPNDDFNKHKNNNVFANLLGKVAGVDVSYPVYSGSGVNINIRGINSITGSNQPLYLIDGVPINDRDLSVGSKIGNGGIDYGSIIADINSEDIEEISVLKDAEASIYGNRAINGIILIRTKKPELNEGIKVNFNTSIMFNTFNRDYLSRFQNIYGGGDSDKLKTIMIDGKEYKVVDYSKNMSWGPKMEGQEVLHWDAFDKDNKDKYLKVRPFSPTKNDIDKFFDMGVLYKNTISMNGGGENTAYRISYTNYNENSIIGSKINKNIFNGDISVNITDEFRYFAWASYIDNYVEGRPYNGNIGSNPLRAILLGTQRQLDYNLLKSYKSSESDNNTWNRTDWNDPKPKYEDNPYFIINEYLQTDQRNRILANTGLSYNLFEDINFIFRASIDNYNERQREGIPIGSINTSKYSNRNIKDSRYSLDIILSGSFDIIDDISSYFVLGYNTTKNIYSYNSQSTKGGLIKRVWNISSSALTNIDTREKYLNEYIKSFFLDWSFSYSNIFYLNGGFRDDWINNEFNDNNKLFYPSFSFSFMLSELFENKYYFPYIKLKSHLSKVINKFDISHMNAYKDLNDGIYTPDDSIIIEKINNESKISIGGGLEIVFKEIIRLDFDYYQNTISNQIADIKVSNSSGYKYKKSNIGDVKNIGFEFGFFVNPIKTDVFSWDITINWSKNFNKLLIDQSIELAKIQDDVSIWAVKDKSYATIRGTNYVYNSENGKRIVNDDGYYKLSQIEDIGNTSRDWMGSIKNSFKYRDLSFSILIDAKKGGDIYSASSYYSKYSGLHKETAINNENGKSVRDPIDEGGGVVLEGVRENGSVNSKRVAVNAEYYRKMPKAAFVYDATYFKVREVVISYDFKNIIGLVNKAKLSLVAKNIFVIHKEAGVDSEYGYGIGNVRGIEYGSIPMIRSWGFNLSIGF